MNGGGEWRKKGKSQKSGYPLFWPHFYLEVLLDPIGDFVRETFPCGGVSCNIDNE